MNTGELLTTVSKRTKLPVAQAKRLLNTTIDIIQTQVKKGDSVKITGFGTFERAKRKARAGRNPQTGEAIKIPSRKFPKFRPGSKFKTTVHGK